MLNFTLIKKIATLYFRYFLPLARTTYKEPCCGLNFQSFLISNKNIVIHVNVIKLDL